MTLIAKKLARKEQIQAKATSLFREKGFNASSMRHLAENLGIEAASLYNHISSKDELLTSICFNVGKLFMEQLESVENAALNPNEKTEAIIRFHIRMMLGKFEMVYVSNRDYKHLKEPYLSEFQALRRDYEKRFSTIIEEGIMQAQFAERNTYVAVLMILSAVRGIELWHKSKKNIPADKLEEDLTSMLMAGLKN
jgi:AcrR family transcriptional regulator